MDDLKTTIALPARIAEQVRSQVQEGWFPDVNSLIIEALRRYLETHQNQVIEQLY